MKYSKLSLAVLFAVSYSSVAAQSDPDDDEFFDDFYGSEEMVELATGIKTQIYKAPAVASVFTAEHIKNMGALDIDDVLEKVPGLHVSRSSNGYNPIYVFRGIHSIYNPQVLMLINGIPITNNFWGNRGQVWGGMSVESVARIEVIRGPGSALYGADAFAGVINIITKSAEHINKTDVGVRVGSESTQTAWVSVSDGDDDLNYAMTLEYHKTDGSDKTIIADAQTFFDGIFGTNASLAPGKLSLGTENVELRSEINYQNLKLRAGLQKRNNVGSGVGIGEALDPTSNQLSNRWNLDASYKGEVSTELSFDINAAYFKTSQEIKNNYIIYPSGTDIGFGAPFPDGFIGNPEVFEKHLRLNANFLYTGLQGHTLKFGLGHHLADMYKTKESKNFAFGPTGEFLVPGSPIVDVSDSPFEFLKETDRENNYLYVQDVWTVASDWELTAGVRYDDYSDFGDITNPRLALVWANSVSLSTKLLYGKAFRAPSFAGMGNINNPVILGNENLQPEVIETVELAFDYHPQTDIGAVWSFYRYDWSDIIQYVPDEGQSTNTAQNFGGQIGYGTEVEFNWKINRDLVLSANASINRSTYELTDEDAAFVPSRQVYVQLHWNINDEMSLNLNSNWIMDRKRERIDRFDNPSDSRPQIDDYLMTDLTFRWTPMEQNFETAIFIKNLLDEDAYEPSINSGMTVNIPNDLPLSGRNIYAEVRYRF